MTSAATPGRRARWRRVDPADVVIIEGILVLHMERIRELLHMKVRGGGRGGDTVVNDIILTSTAGGASNGESSEEKHIALAG